MSSEVAVREDEAMGLRRAPALSAREGLLGSAVVFVAMVAAVLALGAPVVGLPVVLWLLTLLTVPGLAMVPQRAGSAPARWWGSVVALSLTVETLGYVVMVWTTAWHPRVLTFLVLVVSANVIAVRVLVPWWTSRVWDSPLKRRLCLAAIALTVGGAVALLRASSRGAESVLGVSSDLAVEPAPLPPVAPAPSSPTASWTVVTDDGRQVPLVDAVRVGRVRNGEVDELDGRELTLVDSTRTMSRRQLVLSVEGDTVLLVDQGSLNGALVQHRSGEVESCEPGGRLLLGDGDVVQIAERRLTLVRQ